MTQTRIIQQFTFFLATAFIGLMAGLAAVGFEYASAWLMQQGVIAFSHLSFWLFAFLTFGLVCCGALITGWLMQEFAPDAPGSGIPQVKVAYVNKNPEFSWNLLWVKFFGGILSLGTGSSLGREGPTIHIGAAIASKIARFVKEPKDAQNNAICAGAAAGLAAAFNSPLAGVILVLEEIAESQNMEKYAGRCLLASAISVSTVYLLTGDTAALPIKTNIMMRDEVFWLSPLVAIFAGSIGVVFQGLTLYVRKWFKKSMFPLWLRPAIGAAFSAFLGITAFTMTSKLGVFGLGEQDLHEALMGQIIWENAVWLLLAKLFATILCYGSGGCGGIFAPLIFFGGMTGIMMDGLLGEWLHLNQNEQTLLSLIGMTACLSSVVRAPLTSIIIVVEMTRQLSVLPALMVAAVVGVFINDLFFRSNFYNETLKQDHVKLDFKLSCS